MHLLADKSEQSSERVAPAMCWCGVTKLLMQSSADRSNILLDLPDVKVKMVKVIKMNDDTLHVLYLPRCCDMYVFSSYLFVFCFMSTVMLLWLLPATRQNQEQASKSQDQRNGEL